MQRFFTTAFICILIFCALFRAQAVFAATPTPSPTTVVPTPQVGTAVSGGVANEPLPIGGSVEIDEDTPDDAIISIPLDARMDAKKITAPDMSIPARLFNGALPFLYPLQLRSLLKTPKEDQYFVSGKTAICVNGQIKKRSTTAYKTAPLSKLSDLISGAFGLAFLGNESLSRNPDGQYDIAPESQEQAQSPECADTATGDTQSGEDVAITQPFESISTFVEILRSLITGFTTSAQGTVVSNTLVPHTGEIESKTAKLAATYLPSSMDASNGKDNGQIANPLINGATINMNFEKTAKIDAEAKTILCSLVPKAKRTSVGLSDTECIRKVENTATTTCTTGTLPAFVIDATCKLKSTTVNGFTLSPKLVETIEAAASAYDVPASLMIAIMHGEGAFKRSKVFTSTAVDTYLDGCTLLPNCTGPTENIVPFTDWGDVVDAVKIIDPARTPNACNLTDGIFALAESLHRFQFAAAFYDPEAKKPRQCFGLDLVSTWDGAAKTCTDWKDTNAETAIRFWELGNGWDDKSKSCATQMGTCQSGGGGTASGLQCINGKDNCEQINKRTGYTTDATISHNGCVWNVYASH